MGSEDDAHLFDGVGVASEDGPFPPRPNLLRPILPLEMRLQATHARSVNLTSAEHQPSHWKGVQL